MNDNNTPRPSAHDDALADSLSVSPAQIAELTSIIAASKDQLMAPTEFCEVWPKVQNGLSTLKDVLQVVPGISGLVVPAIVIVLTAGSAAASHYCPK
ncbi:hypothetical protein [Massilia sp. PWRC2]|uniref:hypothetical protein n=1 Tax=Massilia sp. PWRC2 TaxID=2804626 RepID=UPI003CFB5028